MRKINALWLWMFINKASKKKKNKIEIDLDELAKQINTFIENK